MAELKTQHELTAAETADLRADVQQQPAHDVIARATIKNGVLAASEDPQAAVRLNRTFSVELPTGKVSNQKHSGRCWLFSTLNTIRHQFAAKYHVKDFELRLNGLISFTIGFYARLTNRWIRVKWPRFSTILVAMVVSGPWARHSFKNTGWFQ